MIPRKFSFELHSLALLSALAATTQVNAALSLDFNTPGDFSSNFSTAQTPAIVESASGGLNGSGSVDLSGLGGTVINFYTLNTSFSGSLSSWTASVYYHGDANAFYQFGFTTDAAPGESGSFMSQDGGTTFLPFIYLGSGNADGGSVGFIGYHSGLSSTDDHVVETNIDLPETDAWYRYDLGVNYLGGDSYQITATLSQASSDGSVVSTLGTITGTTLNPALAADDSVHLYFGLYDGAALDQFETTAVTLVPEPTSALLLLGGMVGFGFRRRRDVR
ncbi:hypothetical protein HNR46_000170 [Haloferula luteola]|uniref:Ice-binding protein C-terminal domain-containing protein n=1 Tax=Haloferula luteola TaxID=595692 RepID=A0A840V852_9BACT|nr:PEP-CTERM sorting domain-containing protein [Haloferula luteola]MBB5349949.1 hypothetical protein [Haloferula luteola]